MAKQNVGFGERHLEKLVVGVAGTVLAAMLFLYVVQDPYSIEISGETLGPSSFYPQLDEQATRMLGALKNAQTPEIEEWKPPTPPSQRNPTELPVVFAPLYPPVPRLDSQIELGTKLDLVEILPPGRPALTSGRAFAALPAGKVNVIGGEQRDAELASSDAPQDCHWVTVFATVPRRAQQEAFIAAKYAVDRQLLIVTQVEAERQRLLPGGSWGEPEKVTRPFTPVILSGKKSVELLTQDGEPVIDPEEYKFIEAFKTEAVAAQAGILRPGFQAVLPQDSQLEWKVPDSLPDGEVFGWVSDYGLILPAEGAAADAGSAAARVDHRKAKAEIDALVAEEKYIEADRKVSQLLLVETIPPSVKKELEQLQTQLVAKVKQQADRLEVERARQQELQEATLGPDVDLLWLTDLSATPGETYRYRVRMSALNPHAGLIRKLRNPEDAAKVVLTGQWSEWSDPVALKPAKYLFCTGLDSDQGVKVELNQWAQGQWDKTNQVLRLGEPARFQDKLKDFTYDAVAALLDPAAEYAERSADRRGIRYRDPRPTAAVVFIRSDGEVEEHLVLEDVTKRRELNAELMAKPEAQPARTITPTGTGGRSAPRAVGAGARPREAG